MINRIKRVLKALIASLIIFVFACVMAILVNLLVDTFPILAVAIAIVLLIFYGFIVTSD